MGRRGRFGREICISRIIAITAYARCPEELSRPWPAMAPGRSLVTAVRRPARSLQYPTGVALDALGNLYIADTKNNRIREVSGGTITTVAGGGTEGAAGPSVGEAIGDGGSATNAFSINRSPSRSMDPATFISPTV